MNLPINLRDCSSCSMYLKYLPETEKDSFD